MTVTPGALHTLPLDVVRRLGRLLGDSRRGVNVYPVRRACWARGLGLVGGLLGRGELFQLVGGREQW
jgi:hypothetical protein